MAFYKAAKTHSKMKGTTRIGKERKRKRKYNKNRKGGKDKNHNFG